jgi:magnesium-transporting ATPase (P-type)
MCGCLDNVYTLISLATLTEVFPCFSLSCKAKARVQLAKTGHGQHSSKFLICVVLFVIRVVLLLIVMFYVLFMCKCVLPTGVNPIAVDKYINININTEKFHYNSVEKISGILLAILYCY